jgi:predicted short-subunit dehydrogenase-like oxidoreductase (DUF2520 family)
MNGDIGIIGLGRLGMSLYSALAGIGREPAAASSRTYRKEFGGLNYYADLFDTVNRSYVVFLCMNDDSIEAAAGSISQMPVSLEGKIFVHFSGLLSSGALVGLKRKGARTASFHPLQTFPDACSGSNFRHIFFTFEGDDILPVLEDIFKDLDPRIMKIDAGKKPIYHAAAVISSNLLCALLGISDRLLRLADMDEGLELHRDLIYKTIENIFKNGIQYSLTGPAARGDIIPVRHHLSALEGDELKIYRLLSLEAARIGRRAHPEDTSKYDLMEKELAGIEHESVKDNVEGT